MKNKLMTTITLTLLLAGQSAIAQNDSEEFLSWLNAGQEAIIVQADKSLQFSKTSMMSNMQTNYDSKKDIFSIDFSSDK